MTHYVLELVQEIAGIESKIYPVLIHTEDDLILVDAGYPNQMPVIRDALNRFGFKIEDLTKVIITHHDHDHMGSLAALKRLNPEMMVYASEFERPFISGEKTSMRLEQARRYNETLEGEALIFGQQFERYLSTIEPCHVEGVLSGDLNFLEGIDIIETPGHTPGHISLYLKKEKVLITGDACVLEKGFLEIANPEFTLDFPSSFQSLSKILKLSPNKLICYHGGQLKENVDGALRKLIDMASK